MNPNLKLVEACALAFLEEFGTDCRKRLPEIATSLGLEVVEMKAESYDGALLRIQGTHLGTIVINSQIREAARKLFTLGHEIGHYLLPNQQELLTPCVPDHIERWRDAKAQAVETEANRFAAEILIPRAEIADVLTSRPSFVAIRSIADRCGVSLTAAAYRLVELSSYRAAIVWSRDDNALWYSSSQEFGRAVRRGSLDSQTYAHDWFHSCELPERFEEVPATAWLYEANLREGAVVLEHSVALPSYNSVLSLVVIPEPIERRTEFEDYSQDDVSLDPEEFTLARKQWPKR